MKLPNPLKPCKGCLERREKISAIFSNVIAHLNKGEVPPISAFHAPPDESKNKKKTGPSNG